MQVTATHHPACVQGHAVQMSLRKDCSVSATLDLFLFRVKTMGGDANLDGQGSMLHSFSLGLGFTFSG